MAAELKVDRRDQRGKHNARRMRREGLIPAVLYGHGEETVSLSVSADELDALVHHGTRMVNLTGAANESAFIRELQWDTWGVHVLHADFTRVSAEEKVELVVTVVLRGESPGVKEGGVVEHLIHEVEIECPAMSIPEHIDVNINHLGLGQSISVADLLLPKDARVIGEADAVVVQCVVPAELPEEAEAEAVAGEPEVIGKKAEEDEGEES